MGDDTISRQAAINALSKALYEYEDKTEKQFQESEDLDIYDWMVHRIFVQNMNVIDRKTILELPSAERWIPIADWLPEEEGRYLVSCGTDYGVEVGRFYIDEDGERYFGCDWNDPDDIEAWMPLPEPYKRGEWNG